MDVFMVKGGEKTKPNKPNLPAPKGVEWGLVNDLFQDVMVY